MIICFREQRGVGQLCSQMKLSLVPTRPWRFCADLLLYCGAVLNTKWKPHRGRLCSCPDLHANGAVLVSYSQCLRTLRKTGELMRHCTRQVLADFRGSCVLSPQASADVGIYCPCESGFCVAPRNFVYLQEKKAFSSRDLDSVFDG